MINLCAAERSPIVTFNKYKPAPISLTSNASVVNSVFKTFLPIASNNSMFLTPAKGDLIVTKPLFTGLG